VPDVLAVVEVDRREQDAATRGTHRVPGQVGLHQRAHDRPDTQDHLGGRGRVVDGRRQCAQCDVIELAQAEVDVLLHGAGVAEDHGRAGWRPDEPQDDVNNVYCWASVARKS
jgi:hypothetical protein